MSMRTAEWDKSKQFEPDKKVRASAFAIADMRGTQRLAGSRASSPLHLLGGEGRSTNCSGVLSTAAD